MSGASHERLGLLKMDRFFFACPQAANFYQEYQHWQRQLGKSHKGQQKTWMIFNHLRFIKKKQRFLNFTICSTEAHPRIKTIWEGWLLPPRLRLLNSDIQDLSIGRTINSFYKLIRYQKHFGKSMHISNKGQTTLPCPTIDYTIFFCLSWVWVPSVSAMNLFTPEKFGGTELIQPPTVPKNILQIGLEQQKHASFLDQPMSWEKQDKFPRK